MANKSKPKQTIFAVENKFEQSLMRPGNKYTRKNRNEKEKNMFKFKFSWKRIISKNENHEMLIEVLKQIFFSFIPQYEYFETCFYPDYVVLL